MSFKFFFWLTLISCSVGCNKLEPSPHQEFQTEVLVVGAGTSGVAAALQAARSGAQVIVVEETPWLGGMLTSAGVSATDGNHQLPSGIWGEFREQLYEYYGGPDSVATGWVSNTQFEPHVGNQIWNNLLDAQASIKRFHGYIPIHVVKIEDTVIGVWFVNQSQDTLKVKADITIEATELGDVLALADIPFHFGQDAKSLTLEAPAPSLGTDHIQDLTYTMILKDFGAETSHSIQEPPGYDPQEFECVCREACDDEEVTILSCAQMLDYGKLPNNKYMINWPNNGNDYYLNSVNMTWQERQEVYNEAKLQSLRFLYHLQTLAGLSNLGIAEDYPTEDGLPFIPYHRESRRVQGLEFLTINHLVEPQFYDLYQSAVAVGDYPLDHHHGKNALAAEETFPAIPSFSIPYGCLIPQTTNGIIVGEKSISVSHLANGATRLQPCVILIGQAAGAAAALSVLDQHQPRELPLRTLQQHLLEQGCWLLPFLDTKPQDSLYFPAIQRVGLTGLMHGTGVPYKWANQTWFYPDSAFFISDLIKALETLNVDVIREFETDDVLTRSEMLQDLWHAVGGPSPNQSAPYLDTTASDSAINYCFQKGWLHPWTGMEYFNPQQPITRKEAAYLLDQVFKPFHNL